MQGITAVLKKELRSYFFSPVAYIVMGVFLLIMGVIFVRFVAYYMSYAQAQQFGQQSSVTLDQLAAQLYNNMTFMLCLVTPLITMRLFAEENRQHTMELLLTVPVRVGELVIGKFLAAFFLLTVIALVSSVYAVFMVMWGNPDIYIILVTYVGMLLSLGCYIALGAFISSCTKSQAIAAVITIFAVLGLYIMPGISQGITASWGPIEWGPVLVYLSPVSHFNGFVQGLIQVKDVVYLLTFIVLMLFLTHRVVESNRWR